LHTILQSEGQLDTVLLSDGIYTSPYERHQTVVQGSLAYDGIQNKLSELRPQGLNLDAVE
jgi:hypothetical protein